MEIAALFKQLVEQKIGRIVLGIRTQPLDHIRKLTHLQRAAAQLGIAVGSVEDVKERRVVLVRKIKRCLHTLGADTARRVVDDTCQTKIVPRYCDHVQIREHVLDLGTVKEAGAADDAIRYAVALEGVFKLVRLGVHAIEHGMIAPIGTVAVIRHDLRGNVLRLVVFIVRDI